MTYLDPWGQQRCSLQWMMKVLAWWQQGFPKKAKSTGDTEGLGSGSSGGKSVDGGSDSSGDGSSRQERRKATFGSTPRGQRSSNGKKNKWSSCSRRYLLIQFIKWSAQITSLNPKNKNRYIRYPEWPTLSQVCLRGNQISVELKDLWLVQNLRGSHSVLSHIWLLKFWFEYWFLFWDESQRFGKQTCYLDITCVCKGPAAVYYKRYGLIVVYY